MDLDSPFLKTALVQGSTGVVEEREVQAAKVVGEQIELTTTKGGIALFPKDNILGLLPKYPEPGIVYRLEDVDQAIRLLESAPEDVKQRADASAATIQKWKDLRKPAEEAEAKRREEEKKAEEDRIRKEEEKISVWLKDAADFQKPRSEADLAKIRAEGEKFIELKVGDEEKVRDGLALLAQVVGKEKGGPLPELAKLNEIQPQLVADDLIVWVVVGVLIVSFFGLLIGLSFTSNGLTRVREGALLGGIVFGGFGVLVLAGLALIWWPVGGAGEPWPLSVSPDMERVITFSKNSVKPVYYLPSIEFRVPVQDFASGVLGSLSPSIEAVGMFKGKLKQGDLWVVKDRFIWRQPVTALGIPLPVTFLFEGKVPSPEAWQVFEFDKVSLGKVIIPEPVGSSFCEAMKSSIQSGLGAGGFSGIKVKVVDGGNLTILTASSGKKPEITTTTTTTTTYRREITAEDLAKVFVENKGSEFKGKFIVIEGIVDKVSSGSEFSGAQVASQGNTLSKPNLRIKDDAFDVFYLRAMDSYGFRKDPLFIKLIIKSPDVFVTDTYGDIYKGLNANVVKEKPFIKKGYRVKFLKEGRVQSDQIKNNEIEVYGVEIDGDSDIQAFDPSAPPPK